MRYFNQAGANPKINAQFFIAGPRDESQVMPEIRAILDKPGIKTVAIEFDHGSGLRIELFEKMPEPAKEPDHAQ